MKPIPSSSRPRGRAARRARTCRPDLSALEPRWLLSVNGDLLTYHGDNASTGLDPYETVLTPGAVQNASVAAPSFGKLYSTPVDGQVYAQPLTESGVSIQGAAHTVVFVATEHDSLYAIDAPTGAVLWRDSFIDPAHGVTTVPSPADTHSGDLTPEIGITSTPVIDPTTNTLYLVAKTKEVVASGPNAGTHYVQRLHAIDVATGQETHGGPAVIADTLVTNGTHQYVSGPTVAGSAQPNVTIGGVHVVYYDALLQHQRAALTLAPDGHGGSTVYVASASHGDVQPYHGWLVGYDAGSLALKAVFNDSPNGVEGGIWQGGGRIAADAQGSLYFETGNGTFDQALTAPPNGLPRGLPSNGNYGDSFVKLSPDASTSARPNQNGWGVTVADYFTPSNQATLSANDADLGSGGILLVDDPTPGSAHPHLLIGAGKEGRIYVINRDTGQMGEFDPNANHVLQQSSPGTINASFDTPAFFPSTTGGTFYYAAGYGDRAKAFDLKNALAGNFTPTSLSPAADGNYGFPGATATVSSDGMSNGLVWTLDTGPHVLRAYDAANLGTELFASNQAPRGIDQPGSVVKFSVPTVSQGRVFVGTKTSLVSYGLLPPITTVPPAPANLAGTATASQIQLTWSEPAHGVTGFKVERSDNGGAFAVIATPGAGATSYIDSGLPPGSSHRYLVVATNSRGDSGPSNTITVALSAAVPAPWRDGDIGAPGQAGSAGFTPSSRTFTVAGGGSDIWNTSDQFHFVYQTLAGDGTIIARVAGVQNTDPWAKAGVMVRETLAANSAFAFMTITPGNGAAFQDRPTTGGQPVNAGGPGVAAPYWVKLVRSGSTFTGYASPDGVTYTQAGTATIPMASSVFVGLAVTAHNDGLLNFSTFDNVSVTTPQPLFAAHVHFTSDATEAPAGYVGDVGLAYGSRGNGLTFGWDQDNTAAARDRDSAASPDELHDGLIHLQKPSDPNASWSIAVPNGTYRVHVLAGDPNNIDSVFAINVQGVLAVGGTPTASNHWFEGTVQVTVTNGRMTVSNGAGARNNKINAIDIVQLSAAAASPAGAAGPLASGAPAPGDPASTIPQAIPLGDPGPEGIATIPPGRQDQGRKAGRG